MLKDYNMSAFYHLGKANVVADVLSLMTMGSMSHIDEAKSYLVKYVHMLSRLVIRLEDSSYSGFMVDNNS